MKLDSIKAAVAALFGLAAVAGSAEAGIIPVKVTAPLNAVTSTHFDWTYDVMLQSGSEVRTGDYFTIYDFAGFVEGSAVMPTGWALTKSSLGRKEDNLTPNDSPDIDNFWFQYTGATTLKGTVGLGEFVLGSIYDKPAQSEFTARTYNTTLGYKIGTISNTMVAVKPADGGDIDPPVDPEPNETPEPATLALVGLGLPCVGLARWVRKRRELKAAAAV